MKVMYLNVLKKFLVLELHAIRSYEQLITYEPENHREKFQQEASLKNQLIEELKKKVVR